MKILRKVACQETGRDASRWKFVALGLECRFKSQWRSVAHSITTLDWKNQYALRQLFSVPPASELAMSFHSSISFNLNKQTKKSSQSVFLSGIFTRNKYAIFFQIVVENPQRTVWESNVSGVLLKCFNPLVQ